MSEVAKLKQLKSIFEALFFRTYNTRLLFGGDEPFYQAAKEGEPAKIISREDYLSSALHEIAHWSIAGAERRQLDDFGYWYEPDGRTADQQSIFEQVEVKPQAIEWALSIACGHTFNLSADNLEEQAAPSDTFRQAVTQQFLNYWHSGLPERAQCLFDQLVRTFHNGRRPQLSPQLMEQI
ncbi:elongation factor P hydroxylase [Pleionea sediminis]|uniref:elongation factor P hydroxylase n=1 Tax=Pleionea sediminis TaxID=2569479 RepID=UPI001186CB07|nr:elongation factor P hydroxylase [Pleionea sediminis]